MACRVNINDNKVGGEDQYFTTVAILAGVQIYGRVVEASARDGERLFAFDRLQIIYARELTKFAVVMKKKKKK